MKRSTSKRRRCGIGFFEKDHGATGLAVITMACALLFLTTPPVWAGISPWPMFRHDLLHTGRTPYTGPAEPTVGWIFTDAHDGIASSPAIGPDGTIYVGSRDSTLYAINPDGSLRWSFRAGAEIESSPTIDDRGRLYFGTFDGNLYALGTGGPDVGVVSMDLPDEVKADSAYALQVTVGNYRTGNQSFDVTCLIDTAGHIVYGDTMYVDGLGETTSVRLSFSSWTVPPDTGIVYTIRSVTLLGGDDNAYNDTAAARVRSVQKVMDVSHESDDVLPDRFSLELCYPNPFNAETVIPYSISTEDMARRLSEQRVSLKVYDLLGREVRTLVFRFQAAGFYRVAWDGRDDGGETVASGVYFYRLRAGNFVGTRSLVFLK